MSIQVDFDPWSRLGNRMFQYAFGYILSILKNEPLFSDGIPNFNIKKTTGFISNPIYTKSYGDHYVDLHELLTTKRDIVVNSFVQKSNYYIPYRQTLRQKFNVNHLPVINQNKLVVHIRETDYIQTGTFLGYDYYRNEIKQTRFKDVIITTDNSECETVQRLLSEGCTLNTVGQVNSFQHGCDERGMADFFTLLQSENILISQSSFSWWAAFLGKHKAVFFPTNVNGMWKIQPQKDDIDLYFNI